MKFLKKVRAAIERFFSPGISTCGKCRRPWTCVDSHFTSFKYNTSCFPLCEKCWAELKTPHARMPYYRKLWLTWAAQGDSDNNEWGVIKKAVNNEV